MYMNIGLVVDFISMCCYQFVIVCGTSVLLAHKIHTTYMCLFFVENMYCEMANNKCEMIMEFLVFWPMLQDGIVFRGLGFTPLLRPKFYFFFAFLAHLSTKCSG